MKQPKLEELFRKYYHKEIDEKELIILMELITEADSNLLGNMITAEGENLQEIAPVITPEKAQLMLNNILQDGNRNQTRRSWWKYTAAAAAILTGIIITTYTFQANQHSYKSLADNNTATNILPAREKATLILGDHSEVVLDTATNAILGRQGNTTIRLNNGQLGYEGDNPSSQVALNTLKTARGNHYNIRLSDGTQVWLNSATTLQFPTAFNKNERNVTISGEAFFEVAPDPDRPFRVTIANRGTIEVLGTRFNVAAYADEENSATTLIDGSVKITKGNSQQLLTPGQQAVINHQSNIQLNRSPDLSQVLAWRNDVFKFNNASVSSLMKEISRWYDVEVVFKGNFPDDGYTGTISRNVPLEKVLKVLDLNGVHCSINGKVITVMQ